MKKDLKFEIKKAVGGAAFTVRIVTRTRKTEIASVLDDGVIKVRLAVPPEEGKVNPELIRLLAETLEVEESKIEIVAGMDKRDKLISVDGITTEYLEERLATVVGKSDDD